MFSGDFLDTGSHRSVVCKTQYKSYYLFICIPVSIVSSTPNMYNFSSQLKVSVGKSKFPIPYTPGHYMKYGLYFADNFIPLLLGLYVLENFKLYVNIVDNRLRCLNLNWISPLFRKQEYFYYDWNYYLKYTEPELKKIHRHFYDPQPNRIYN